MTRVFVVFAALSVSCKESDPVHAREDEKAKYSLIFMLRHFFQATLHFLDDDGILALPNAAPSSEEVAKSLCKLQVEVSWGLLAARHQSAMTSGNPENIDGPEAALARTGCIFNRQKVAG